MLDQTFDRLQKLVSQLELLGEKLSQEDVNQKLLRCVSQEWNTHVVVWRNKADMDTMSMDDLYNNLKVDELKVKAMSNSYSNTQNMVFLSSINSITNRVVNTAQAVNTVNEVSIASTQVNVVDNLSDAVICAFLTSQPNSPQLAHEDSEQIHPDDIEEMDLRWQKNDLTMHSWLTHLQLLTQSCKKGLGYESYNAVSPPYTGNFMPLKPNLSYTGLDEFAVKPVVKNKTSEEEIKAVRKNTDAPIIEEWVSDDEEENVTQPKMVTKTIKPSIVKKEFVKPRQQEKTARKTVKKVEHNRQNTHRPRGNQRNWNNMMSQKLGSNFKIFNKAYYDKRVIDSGYSRHMTENMSYLTEYKEIDGGYVAFGGNPKGGKITGKGTIKTATKDETSGILKSFITRIENLADHKVKVIRCDNRTEFKNSEMNQFCEMKEAVNIAYYVQNKVLVVKPHNKTPYELFHGRTPTLSFIRPFGCPVTILNTKDHLVKFNGKADEGFFVGYSLNSKAFRVFNSRTKIMEENLHIRFSKYTPNVVSSKPNWLFDIDALIRTINYEPIVAGTQSNDYVEKEDNVNNTNNVNTINAAGTNEDNELPFDPNMPALEYVGTFDFSNKDGDDDIVTDINNMDTTIQVNPTPTTRIHKDHPLDQVIEDLHSATQTRQMLKNLEEHGLVSTIQQRTNHKDL
uniref:Uncharacterized protein n=1 Tax=Tanacetum cinerariifolium TaxID=118510 RepID=A0A699HQV2_TANCI|nr:hypothetical protein [Tanacetum cinerariifolium]